MDGHVSYSLYDNTNISNYGSYTVTIFLLCVNLNFIQCRQNVYRMNFIVHCTEVSCNSNIRMVMH